MKALVVDDSAIIRRIIVNTLQGMDFEEILEATDGESAIALLKPGLDLVITDWNMPGMAGVEFTRQLRANPDWASVPILMVSSRNLKEDVIEAASAGVTGSVSKPFTPEMLRDKIHELLKPQAGATGTDG